MKLQSRTKHAFIELKVDEIEETIFKSHQKRIQEMIDNLTDEALASLGGEERWISVNDKLPEQEDHVIIKCTGHRVSTTGYIHERGHWIISNGKGTTYKENQMHKVTHWQPLPEPPNENNIKPPHPSEREVLEGFVAHIKKYRGTEYELNIDRYLAEKQSKTEKK